MYLHENISSAMPMEVSQYAGQTVRGRRVSNRDTTPTGSDDGSINELGNEVGLARRSPDTGPEISILGSAGDDNQLTTKVQ